MLAVIYVFDASVGPVRERQSLPQVSLPCVAYCYVRIGKASWKGSMIYVGIYRSPTVKFGRRISGLVLQGEEAFPVAGYLRRVVCVMISHWRENMRYRRFSWKNKVGRTRLKGQ